MELVTGENDNNRRLDRILRRALQDASLSFIHRLLRQGRVLVNGKPAGPGLRVAAGSTIRVKLPAADASLPAKTREEAPPVQSVGAPGSTTLEKEIPVIWQGAGLLVLNKPAGMAVHGEHSLDTLVRAYLADRLPPSLSFRPGPLHRLDKPTSGIIVFSSSLEGARLFSSLMRGRKLQKRYLALLEGRFEKEEIWQDSLARNTALRKTFVVDNDDERAQSAVSRVRPLAADGEYTLVSVDIETGRTHQIRSQAAAHGHPLAGDRKYGGKPLPGSGGSFLLHAWQLAVPAEIAAAAGLPALLQAPPPETFRYWFAYRGGSVGPNIRTTGFGTTSI